MKWLQAAVLAVLMTGCSGNAPVSLSVRTGAPRTALAGVISQRLDVSNGITLTRARLLVRKIQLKTAEAAVATAQREEDDNAKIEGREELDAGPLVLDLSGTALDGNVQKVIDVAVPAGTYKKVEFKIARASTDQSTSSDANVKALADKQASLILEGTIDGQAFEFVSALEVKQEFEGTFVLGGEANNLTLNVDPSGWFTDGSGARLDPRDPSVRSTIESNIKSSMKMLDDDNHDGREDDHGSESGDKKGDSLN